MASLNSVPASKGWEWFGCGWKLFLKNPGVWVLFAVILLVIVFVLSRIPWIGGLVTALIFPVFGGGLVYAARELDEGRSIEITALFQGFRDSSRVNPLFMLGGIAVAAQIIILLIGVALIGSPLMFGRGGGMAMQFGLFGMLGFLVMFVVLVALSAAMIFAVPQVMLAGTEPWTAVRNSLDACLRNLPAMVIFMIVYVVLAFLAMIPFGLGFLILGPVAVGAVYCAYRSVFA